MRTLLLLRHAKSSWDDADLDDFDRPLAGRGRRAAPRLGRFIQSKPGAPDLALVSAAARARQTWELVAAELAPAPPAKILRSLYLATPSRLLAAVRRVSDDTSRLLLVGHNPGMETLAAELCGDGKRAALAAMAAKYPTAALAEIRFDVDRWKEVAPGTGRLRRFTRPKDLD